MVKPSYLNTVGTTLLCCILLFVAFQPLTIQTIPASQPTETLSLRYTFDKPHLTQTTIENTTYHTLSMPHTSLYGQLGEPALPARGAYILLPPHTTVQTITVTPGSEHRYTSPITPTPVETPHPFSLPPQSSHHLPVDEKTTHTLDTAQNSYYTTVGTYIYRGYYILILVLHPQRYDPTTKTLTYTSTLTVKVTVQPDSNFEASLYRGVSHDEQRVQTLVDNPALITRYAQICPQKTTEEQSTYVILTTKSLQSAFIPLHEDNELMGIPTSIITLEDLDDTTPESIRSYLRNAYLSQGAEYILLGGDVDQIPTQKLWVEPWANSGYARNIPADMFYGCLDGTFNYDGDTRWGEPTDGDNGGDVDLLAELYIGRASVSTLAEARIFVEKTINYRCYMGDHLKKITLVGEKLWSNPNTWGGNYMDELINGSTAHGYTTVGIPPDNYTIEKLYDKTEPWAYTEIKQRINDNLHIIHHLGHSDYRYNMKLRTRDVSELTNEKACFIYSQGCNAGGFDTSDCIAEHFTIRTLQGAVAVIMNARYGWGVKGSTNGPSQHFHREFVDALYGEHIPTIAMANQDSKEDNLWRINDPCMRWCTYQLNVLGDPMMSFSEQYTPTTFDIQDITSGFGSITLTVKNTGEVDARMITWDMDITGGLSGRLDILVDRFFVTTKGTIRPVPVNTVKNATLKPLFAFGKITIALTTEIPTVQTITKTIHARGLGFYIIIEDVQ